MVVKGPVPKVNKPLDMNSVVRIIEFSQAKDGQNLTLLSRNRFTCLSQNVRHTARLVWIGQ